MSSRSLRIAPVLAILAAVTASAGAGAATTRIPVVRCPTVFGVAGNHPRAPATLAVDAAGPAHGLVAYTNTDLFLIAPRGLRCSGIVAADGGTQVVVWAAGERKPQPHSRGIGLTLTVDPACASCRADDACPFFTTLARQAGFPCTAGIPAGERVRRPSRSVALFEDPPGVRDSGWPSGGPLPANGVVGTLPSSTEALVYRATCTLPAADHAICTESLDDVIARYG
ncbi:MAG: hypothetical protein ACRDLP_07685 [Solirubrobacteraceae bacterium]